MLVGDGHRSVQVSGERRYADPASALGHLPVGGGGDLEDSAARIGRHVELCRRHFQGRFGADLRDGDGLGGHPSTARNGDGGRSGVVAAVGGTRDLQGAVARAGGGAHACPGSRGGDCPGHISGNRGTLRAPGLGIAQGGRGNRERQGRALGEGEGDIGREEIAAHGDVLAAAIVAVKKADVVLSRAVEQRRSLEHQPVHISASRDEVVVFLYRGEHAHQVVVGIKNTRVITPVEGSVAQVEDVDRKGECGANRDGAGGGGERLA